MSKLKLCTKAGCNTVVKDGARCEQHRHNRSSNSENNHIYKGRRWQNVRAIKIARNPICEMCERLGEVKAADVVDHIKEISDGGAVYDLNNLQSLCHYHHNNKTQKEKRARQNKVKSRFRI